MVSYYSGDHIAEDHIHMDITTCTIEELRQKYRLGTVSNSRLLGVRAGLKHVVLIKPSPFASVVVRNIWSA